MSGTDLSIERRLRALMGPDAIIERDGGGMPTVAPRTTEACALVLATANSEGWRVRITGGGSWNRVEGHADLALSSSGLSDVEEVRAADLVATVQAGVVRETLRLALADQGAWWPVDPPGIRRTVGSVVATATAGPLRSGLGGIRDHVLGLTVVTAEGGSRLLAIRAPAPPAAPHPRDRPRLAPAADAPAVTATRPARRRLQPGVRACLAPA